METVHFGEKRLGILRSSGTTTTATALGNGINDHVVGNGIGFGKTVAHNLQILEQLALFHATGCTVMVGASRKSFIGALVDCDDAAARLPGSLAAATIAAGHGAHFHRVHDVAETRQALMIARAIGEPT